jgi:hypothetical protein
VKEQEWLRVKLHNAIDNMIIVANRLNAEATLQALREQSTNPRPEERRAQRAWDFVKWAHRLDEIAYDHPEQRSFDGWIELAKSSELERRRHALLKKFYG